MKPVIPSHQTETPPKKPIAPSHETETSLKKPVTPLHETETPLKKPLVSSHDAETSLKMPSGEDSERQHAKTVARDLGVDMRQSNSSDDEDDEDDEADVANADEDRALTQYEAEGSRRQVGGSIPRQLGPADSGGMRFSSCLNGIMSPSMTLQMDAAFVGQFQNMAQRSDDQAARVTSLMTNASPMKLNVKQQQIYHKKVGR